MTEQINNVQKLSARSDVSPATGAWQRVVLPTVMAHTVDAAFHYPLHAQESVIVMERHNIYNPQTCLKLARAIGLVQRDTGAFRTDGQYVNLSVFRARLSPHLTPGSPEEQLLTEMEGDLEDMKEAGFTTAKLFIQFSGGHYIHTNRDDEGVAINIHSAPVVLPGEKCVVQGDDQVNTTVRTVGGMLANGVTTRPGDILRFLGQFNSSAAAGDAVVHEHRMMPTVEDGLIIPSLALEGHKVQTNRPRKIFAF